MAIVDDDIERVRSASPIVDVVQLHVQLKKTGRSWVGLCPFHAEKSGSFHVGEEFGRYKCFGCQAGGDVFTFVQEIDHVDFVAAVEWLAGRAGIQLTYTTGGEGRDRQRRRQLVDAMEKAVEWYHQRLLTAPDGRPARDYLRQRGISGEVARQFRIGWAPEGWDELCRGVGLPDQVLRETGLGFVNSRNRLTDAFRGRVLFPIFSETCDAVAFGGRILPGSTDPAKYKNSPETPIYTKSKTLYALNWAKADIVAQNQVVVCEGYTDVIGFHRSGVPRAVATCGTALTEEHVRLLKRYANRVVLAFDADAAGQGAADRFYEWERKYEIEVAVAQLPPGRDPGDLAQQDPDALRAAVADAQPFLGYRLQRVLRATALTSPESRARVAEAAMVIVNEHPDVTVRTIYAGQVAAHCGLPVHDLVALAKGRSARVHVQAPTARPAARESGEVVALHLLLHRWNEIAEQLIEPLFRDEVNLAAFRAIALAEADLTKALEIAEPAARELIERLAVADYDADPDLEARNLIAAATRREIDRIAAQRDLALAGELGDAKRLLELLDDPGTGPVAADQLLTWLDRRNEERA